MPSEQARGPWDPRALHGGAPAALIASAFERHDPVEGTQISRLGFELLRPIPFAPLRIETHTLRPGRRVQELAAELHADMGDDGEQLVARANALRVAAIPDELPELPDGARAEERMPGPDEGRPLTFALNPEVDEASFAATAMEMRWLNDPWAPGPGRVWQRLRYPLVDDASASPLARLAASADFGNGISARCPSRTGCSSTPTCTCTSIASPAANGSGSTRARCCTRAAPASPETVLHDVDGPVGRGFQALVVAPR